MQNYQLLTKSHIELEDNSIIYGEKVCSYLLRKQFYNLQEGGLRNLPA